MVLKEVDVRVNELSKMPGTERLETVVGDGSCLLVEHHVMIMTYTACVMMIGLPCRLYNYDTKKIVEHKYI